MATVILKPGAYNCKAAHGSNVASLSGTGTFGGVALSAGEIVLLYAQSTASQSGPYIVRAGAWDRIAHPGGTLRTGDAWYIESGTNTKKTYQVTTAGPIVLGTTNLTIEPMSAGGGGAMSLSDAAPAPLGITAPGTGTKASRDDHVHEHGDQDGGTLHEEVTGSVAGFMSASDKTKLDAVPDTTLLTNLTLAVLIGNGTPEGAVTAVVGTLYLRRNGGTSTTLYVKESGTGNTGWVAK